MIITFPTLTIRPNRLLKGEWIDGHAHTFDHVTAVVLGVCKVEVETDTGKRGSKIIVAPNERIVLENVTHSVDRSCFNVPANWKHKITALSDVLETWCMYVPRDETGEIVERFAADTDYEWVTG